MIEVINYIPVGWMKLDDIIESKVRAHPFEPSLKVPYKLLGGKFVKVKNENELALIKMIDYEDSRNLRTFKNISATDWAEDVVYTVIERIESDLRDLNIFSLVKYIEGVTEELNLIESILNKGNFFSGFYMETTQIQKEFHLEIETLPKRIKERLSDSLKYVLPTVNQILGIGKESFEENKSLKPVGVSEFCDDQPSRDKFDKWLLDLNRKMIIDEDQDWLDTQINLLRFYRTCEIHNLIKLKLKHNRKKGLTIFQEYFKTRLSNENLKPSRLDKITNEELEENFGFLTDFNIPKYR